MKKNRLRYAFPFLVSLLVVACGNPDQSESDAANAAPSEPPAQKEPAPAREIVVTANDRMQFGVESFSVAPGERVRLVLENVGKMPKFSMGHNLVILNNGVDPDAFVEAAASAPGNEYIPPDRTGDILAHTKLLGGGEKDAVTFVAPSKPGERVFLCSFPGHYQMDMKGVMRIEN